MECNLTRIIPTLRFQSVLANRSSGDSEKAEPMTSDPYSAVFPPDVISSQYIRSTVLGDSGSSLPVSAKALARALSSKSCRFVSLSPSV